MWDSDDIPSLNELLLCTFVRFTLFVTKQEIGESNYFFQKVRHLQPPKIYAIVVEASFPKPQVRIAYSFRVKMKPQKAFLSSGNFFHYFSTFKEK